MWPKFNLPNRATRHVLVTFMLCGPCTAGAEDVIFVFHPKTGVDPAELTATLKAERRPSRDWRVVGAISSNPAQLVLGKSAGDAPGGRAFIIYLQEPRTVVISSSIFGKRQDMKQADHHPYKEVVVIQPFSLWHRREPGAAPVFAGQAYVWETDSQVKENDETRTSTHVEFTISKATPAEMTTAAIQKVLPQIPELLPQAVGECLLPGRLHSSTSVEDILTYARRSTEKPEPPVAFKDGRYVIDTTKLLRFPPESENLIVFCAPSRISRNETGETVVEVDLHNRLPNTVRGVLLRSPGKAEAEWNKSVAGRGLKAPKASEQVEFSLRADEKMIAKFLIPPDLSIPLNFIRDSRISLDLWSLGDDAERHIAKEKLSAKKKKKKK